MPLSSSTSSRPHHRSSHSFSSAAGNLTGGGGNATIGGSSNPTTPTGIMSSHRNGSGFFSNPTSSSFLERHFGRRPRTSAGGGNGSQQQVLEEQQQHYNHESSEDLVDSLPGSADQGRPGTSNLNGNTGGGGGGVGGANNTGVLSRLGIQRTSYGLPRSSSSSQVYNIPDSNNSRVSFPSRPRMPASNSSTSVSRPQTTEGRDSPSFSGGVVPSMIRSGSSQGGERSSSNPIGRMLRRYSQGANKNLQALEEARSRGDATALHTDESTAQREQIRPQGQSSREPTPAPRASMTGERHEETAAMGGLPASATLAVLPNGSLGTSSPQRRTSAPDERNTGEASPAMGEGSPAGASGNVPAFASSSSHSHTPAQATSHRLRLVPHLEATRSLHFEPIEREMGEGATAVKIGRFTDRASATGAGAGASTAEAATSSSLMWSAGASAVNNGGAGGGANASSGFPSSSAGGSSAPIARGGAIPAAAGGGGRVDSGRIAFKSKVVSRGHAEVWCEAGGKFFIRDTKSSSGTFLNHIRLSAPNLESKPHQIKDGDVVQLGVDYQGGTEEIYRCVKMRVELNRGWQRGANQFNVNALRQLRALQGSPLGGPAGGETSTATGKASALPTNRQSMNVTDCCICLFSVTVCQALFIAPCSHVFHYKCIRPLLMMHHPGFSCPLCRTFADLEADVEEDEEWQAALLKEAEAASAAENLPINDTSSNEEQAQRLQEPPTVLAAAVAAHPDSPAAAVLMATAEVNEPSSSSILATGSGSRRSISQGHGSDRGSVDSSRSRQTSQRQPRSPPRRQQEPARPDTAVSSTTTVAAAAPPHLSPHGSAPHSSSGLRNIVTPPPDSAEIGPDERDENLEEREEELIPRNRDQGRSSSNRAVSNPIEISNRSSRQGHQLEGLASSPGFADSNTPMNQHFLSTLAEAPPPPRSAVRAMDPPGHHPGHSYNVNGAGSGERRMPSLAASMAASGNTSSSPSSRRPSQQSQLSARMINDRRESSSSSAASYYYPMPNQISVADHHRDSTADLYMTPGQGNSPAASPRAHGRALMDDNEEIDEDALTPSSSNRTSGASKGKDRDATRQGADVVDPKMPATSSFYGVNAMSYGHDNHQHGRSARGNQSPSDTVDGVAASSSSTNSSANSPYRPRSQSGGKMAKFFKRATNTSSSSGSNDNSNALG